MIANTLQPTQWHKRWLIVAGLVCLLRAGIGLYQPDYWSPQVPLDYAAVAGTSLAFLFLSFGLWGFNLNQPVPPSRAQKVWRTGIAISCISAATIGLSNFVEDAFDLNGLGFVWVIGILALLAGLLMAGISAFWVDGFPRWVGLLLLACAASLLMIGSVSFFGMGLALLALGLLNG